METEQAEQAAKAAEDILAKERLLQREKRRVLVASCISYSRAVFALRDLMGGGLPPSSESIIKSGEVFSMDQRQILNLLLQRFGDACNETGKILLASLQATLIQNQGGTKDDGSQLAAEALLDSSQFWFAEGLDAFEACGDVRNLALLRCNLCKSHKWRANYGFAKAKASSKPSSKHSEDCLQEAADQLLKAHEDLGQRDVDPRTWDMVSEELAATFLVLGVRRRQSVLGTGNASIMFVKRPLSPGEERSITDPMEKALKVYDDSGNAHQAAAVHYQLAQTFSKLWTSQLNESHTRKKLAKAFEHYGAAFGYFSAHLQGNEPTFCVLCLDLASLYASITGEEGLNKALGCCLDTSEAFSIQSIEATASIPNADARNRWYESMGTVAKSVEERVFRLLRSLVKLDQDRYKEMYREGLSAKLVHNARDDEEFEGNPKASLLLALHEVLVVIKTKYKA